LVFRFLIVFLFFVFYFFAKSTFSVLHGVISLAMMGTDDQRYLPQDRHAWIRTCPKKGHPGHPQIRSEMWWFSPFWIIPTHFDMISSSQNHHFPPETTKSPSPSFPHLDHNLRGNARCTLDLMYGIDAFLAVQVLKNDRFNLSQFHPIILRLRNLGLKIGYSNFPKRCRKAIYHLFWWNLHFSICCLLLILLMSVS
jgi:hypothetical protein